MKIDPHNYREKYENWKKKVESLGYIKGISKVNSNLIINYVSDMELGINIASVSIKGARSYPRLLNIKQRTIFLAKKFEEIYKLQDLSKITEKQHKFLKNHNC